MPRVGESLLRRSILPGDALRTGLWRAASICVAGWVFTLIASLALAQEPFSAPRSAPLPPGDNTALPEDTSANFAPPTVFTPQPAAKPGIVEPFAAKSPVSCITPPQESGATPATPDLSTSRGLFDSADTPAQSFISPQDAAGANLNSPVGMAIGPQSRSAAMIGDFFGSTGSKSKIVLFTPVTLTGQTVFDQNFNTGGATVPAGRLGFGDPTQNPTPFYVSSGPATVNYSGQFIPLASQQPNAPGAPAGGPPARIYGGGALITGFPPSGPVVAGQVGVANLYYFQAQAVQLSIPSPGNGGGVGSQKIMEGNSPIPRDRVFSFYDFFQNVPLGEGDVNVNRFTPGFEKTFFDRMMSFEMRLPMALTLDSNITPGATQASHAELGNLTMAYKALLFQNNTFGMSTGLGMTVPTADDVNVLGRGGMPILSIANRSMHLQPFAGLLWTPNDTWFSQSFVQVDVDANGNPVGASFFGDRLTYIGRLQSPTYLYASVGVGRWLLRNNPGGWITGIAGITELHLNRSLQSVDTIVAGPYRIGDFSRTIESLNMTLGMTFELRNRGYLTTALVTPLGGGADRQFDGQFRLLYSRRFGPLPGLARY